MKTTLACLSVMLTLNFIGAAQSQHDWATLDTTFYLIQFPTEWELDQDGEMGASFFIFSPWSQK